MKKILYILVISNIVISLNAGQSQPPFSSPYSRGSFLITRQPSTRQFACNNSKWNAEDTLICCQALGAGGVGTLFLTGGHCPTLHFSAACCQSCIGVGCCCCWTTLLAGAIIAHNARQQ